MGAVGVGDVGVGDVGVRGPLLLPGAPPHCPLQAHSFTGEGKIPLIPNFASSRGHRGCKGKSIRAGQVQWGLASPMCAPPAAGDPTPQTEHGFPRFVNPDGILFSQSARAATPACAGGFPHITALHCGLPNPGTEHGTEPRMGRASGELSVTAFWHWAAGLDAIANRK